jgi:serine/threonine protein phosphatase PrpC
VIHKEHQRGYGSTDRGGREKNEDSFGVSDDLGLYLIADGVGGSRYGGLASQLAIDEVTRDIQSNPVELANPHSAEQVFLGSVRRANRTLWAYGRQGRNADVLTTLSGLWCVNSHFIVMHVGDSRIYRWGLAGGLSCLTTDHTSAAELVRQGALAPEEAATHSLRRHLTRVLGAGPQIECDVLIDRLLPMDRFLLCTDGLYEAVAPEELEATLAYVSSEKEQAERLVSLALSRSAKDNVTAIVVHAVRGAGDV